MIDRKTKEVQIGEKQLIVKELTINQMYDHAETLLEFHETATKGEATLPKFHQLLLKIGPALTNWSGEDFLNLTPSQIKGLFPIFKEVNSDFLLILDTLGVSQKWNLVLNQVKMNMEKAGQEEQTEESEQNQKPKEDS